MGSDQHGNYSALLLFVVMLMAVPLVVAGIVRLNDKLEAWMIRTGRLAPFDSSVCSRCGGRREVYTRFTPLSGGIIECPKCCCRERYGDGA